MGDMLSEHFHLFGARHRLWSLHLRIERLPHDGVTFITDFDLVPEVPRVSSPQVTCTRSWAFIPHFNLHQLRRSPYTSSARLLWAWPVKWMYASISVYCPTTTRRIACTRTRLLQQDAEEAFQACAGGYDVVFAAVGKGVDGAEGVAGVAAGC
jgi:hypothetical protein